MALILSLETSTTVCSVALAKAGKILAVKETDEGFKHAENLTLFCEDVMKQAQLNFSDLDAIAVSKGPGSYTGLRIGVSTAKGFCFALDKPLIGINSLQAMAWQVNQKHKTSIDKNTLLCAMIDARRMEVFAAIFDNNNNFVRDTNADIIDENSYTEYLEKNKFLYFGDGAAKCKTILEKNKNTLFIDDIKCSAIGIASLAEEAYTKKQFEDLAYFEPFYLKDFMIGKKKDL
jgi:tRNA threonylcarbamoyladenosine biosynthesis protein TsaB